MTGKQVEREEAATRYTPKPSAGALAGTRWRAAQPLLRGRNIIREADGMAQAKPA